MLTPFASVLVANRGEIAVRIIRATQDAGLRSIAVYAESDHDAPHARLADESYSLHGDTAAETYLDAYKIIDVALASGAEAVHPGYGFLSESPEFAQAVIDAGLVWIGPDPHTIRDLGDKVTARRIADRVGAPLVPGTSAPVEDATEIEKFVAEHGLPVAIKAAHGGGGRGLRVVHEIDDIASAFDSATRESIAAFGRGECFVERYLDKPRHVEAQVLADAYGTVIVVGTRDCTLQRRHQKLVEEAPAPFLTAQQEKDIRAAARAICVESVYRGAGTVEFLVGDDGTVSFLEVNTRLQVEHPVTEQTTGIDLVLEQFRIARGEPLTISHDPEPVGHSFEYRINCEDPGRGFVPQPGTITEWTLPQGPGIRVDSGVEVGSIVGGRFDSLLAKLIVSGPTRKVALARSRRALAEMHVAGVPTVLPFHRGVTRAAAFTAEGGSFGVHTTWIETEGVTLVELESPMGDDASSCSEDANTVSVTIGSRVHRVALPGLDDLGAVADTIRQQSTETTGRASARRSGDDVTAPMQGTVSTLSVADGDTVSGGDLIAVLEAMKMENPVRAHKRGTVAGLEVAEGDTRAGGEVICRII